MPNETGFFIKSILMPNWRSMGSIIPEFSKARIPASNVKPSLSKEVTRPPVFSDFSIISTLCPFLHR